MAVMTVVRAAQPSDVPVLFRFIRELAEYERRSHEVVGSEAALREHLFGPKPACEALLASAAPGSGEPVGFALFFAAYSTFWTAPFMHLEDLYVTPEARGQGHGIALLQALARIALARNYPRFQWNVLEWNQPAIAFYERVGARVLPDWRTCRMDGAALCAFAARATAP
jgi:GNAT superfamily N-acetyltransferase